MSPSQLGPYRHKRLCCISQVQTEEITENDGPVLLQWSDLTTPQDLKVHL